MSMLEKIQQVDLYLDERERFEVDKALADRWLTEGPNCARLQKLIAERLDVRHVFFAPNGTLGLFLSLLALDLPRGSEILIPTFTFYGSAMAAVFAGLKPVFVDADPRTFQATAASMRAQISPSTRAIMPVHIFGQVCEIAEIVELAREHRLVVVEDAAQAYSVRYNGKAAGTFGDIGVFSMFSDKLVTMGEGGVLVTDNDELADRIRLLRNQGRPNAGTFVHPSLGMNFRITDLQAAIGCVQHAKLDQIRADRSHRWNRYTQGLAGVGDLNFMAITEGSELGAFRFPILTNECDKLRAHLEETGIQSRRFFYPMHLQPKLREEPAISLPNAERLSEKGLLLPLHHHISDQHIDRIVTTIRAFFRAPA